MKKLMLAVLLTPNILLAVNLTPCSPELMAERKYCIVLSRLSQKEQHTEDMWAMHLGGRRIYHYVEGELPPRHKFLSDWSDRDVRRYTKEGVKLIFLRSDYTREDLVEARDQCREFIKNGKSVDTLRLERK